MQQRLADRDDEGERCRCPYQYFIDLVKALPLAKTTADDYKALLPWKLGKLARKTKT